MIKASTAVGLVMALSTVAAGATSCPSTTKPVDQVANVPGDLQGIVESVYDRKVPLRTGNKCAVGTMKVSVRLYGTDGVAGTADPVVEFCMPEADAKLYESGDPYPVG